MDVANRAPWRRWVLLMGSLALALGLIFVAFNFVTWNSARDDAENGCFNAPGQGIDQNCRADARELAEAKKGQLVWGFAGFLSGAILVGSALFLPRDWD